MTKERNDLADLGGSVTYLYLLSPVEKNKSPLYK